MSSQKCVTTLKEIFVCLIAEKQWHSLKTLGSICISVEIYDGTDGYLLKHKIYLRKEENRSESFLL